MILYAQKPLLGELPIWVPNPAGIPAPDVFWAMNEGDGDKVTDQSQNERNGTLTGGATWTPEGINFPNAAGNGVVWTDDASLEGANVTEFTLFADFLWTGGGDDWQYVIGKSYDVYQTYVDGAGVRLGNIGFGVRTDGSGGNQYDDEEAFDYIMSPGERCFASATWSSDGTIYFYVNGVLTNSAACAGEYLSTNTHLFSMGNRSGTTIRDFNGNVYIGGMFKKALTPEQIQYFYLHNFYAWEHPELWELYVSSAPGGLSIPVAMHSYMQQ